MRVLYLLRLQRLFAQEALGLLQFRNVLAETEVLLHLALLVQHGVEAEVQVERQPATCTYGGLDVGRLLLVDAVVHVGKHVHALALVAVVNERHAAGLREHELLAAYLVVDGQCVLFGRIACQTHGALLQNVVDVGDVAAQLLVLLLQLVFGHGELLLFLHHGSDVAAEDEGAQRLAMVAADGCFALFDVFAELADASLHVVVVELQVVNVQPGPLQDGARLLVDARQPALLVEEQNAEHGGVEDGPVAQLQCLGGALLYLLAGDILLGAYDDGGASLLVAAQDGERHQEVVQCVVAVLRVDGLQLQGEGRGVLVVVGLLNVADGFLQALEVGGGVAPCKLLGGVVVERLSVLVVPGEEARRRVEGPHAQLAGSHDERQALVLTAVLPVDALRLQPIDDDVGQQDERQRAHQSHDVPHPLW